MLLSNFNGVRAPCLAWFLKASRLPRLSRSRPGLGATLVPDTLARRTSAEVRFFALDPEMPERVVYAASRMSRYVSRAAEAFLAVMRNHAEPFSADNETAARQTCRAASKKSSGSQSK